ncbi:MAG TPA: nitrophenyl compound nitroreductase subunit ArsF family protein [Candidatus Paceibacterota bacterium]|nr:nitrophenyl compound nitroreductase subunit ArsF family protein [Candidatus Paceibacterota bacterium]HRZ54474.1 nitrophenyl compound nitroreductase subunit ArsF family protein [Candidatus Paceibacterota bacterium]
MKPMLPPTDSATSESSVETTRLHVIAYYFHGTVRCDTCLLIENLAKAVIEEQFKADMDARRLTFLPVNYDLPENAHFLKTYSLPCPSLVLVRQTDGQDAGWKLLGDVWQLVHEPPELNRYVAAEVQAFLSGEEQQTGSAPPQPPSAAEQR